MTAEVPGTSQAPTVDDIVRWHQDGALYRVIPCPPGDDPAPAGEVWVTRHGDPLIGAARLPVAELSPVTTVPACTHPGAVVDAYAGRHPVPIPGTPVDEPAHWRPSATGRERRPGEQLHAALGECNRCGAVVVCTVVWHPDDRDGESMPFLLTPWTALHRAGTSPDQPVRRDESNGEDHAE